MDSMALYTNRILLGLDPFDGFLPRMSGNFPLQALAWSHLDFLEFAPSSAKQGQQGSNPQNENLLLNTSSTGDEKSLVYPPLLCNSNKVCSLSTKQKEERATPEFKRYRAHSLGCYHATQPAATSSTVCQLTLLSA